MPCVVAKTDSSSSSSPLSCSLNDLTVGKDSVQALALTKKCHELNYEYDLNDDSVNLVALEEIASSQYSKQFL